MKIFVVYGSDSDKNSYEPLCEKLKAKGHDVYFEVISAHRKPDHLLKTLKEREYDAVVAGAGLSAALPGVVASKTDKPVFGVPVSSHFKGIDAFASIQQMPYGVPVLTISPDREDDIVSFLENPGYKSCNTLTTINLVIDTDIQNEAYVEKELKRTFEFANENNIELVQSSEVNNELPNIILVKDKSEVRKDAFAIHSPILSPEERAKPEKYLDVFNWSQEGGMWVCTNNTRNAIIAMMKLIKHKK